MYMFCLPFSDQVGSRRCDVLRSAFQIKDNVLAVMSCEPNVPEHFCEDVTFARV